MGKRLSKSRKEKKWYELTWIYGGSPINVVRFLQAYSEEQAKTVFSILFNRGNGFMDRKIHGDVQVREVDPSLLPGLSGSKQEELFPREQYPPRQPAQIVRLPQRGRH